MRGRQEHGETGGDFLRQNGRPDETGIRVMTEWLSTTFRI